MYDPMWLRIFELKRCEELNFFLPFISCHLVSLLVYLSLFPPPLVHLDQKRLLAAREAGSPFPLSDTLEIHRALHIN